MAAKHQLENVTLLSITDGDTNRLRIYEDHKLNVKRVETSSGAYWDGKTQITIDGKRALLRDKGRKGTEDLYKNLKKRYGITGKGKRR